MTTYNGEKYISEQLESFVMQTRQPDELIITDDCSTDKTIDILKKFKKNAPFTVKIYKNEENLGYTQNFNKALQLCSGELVFLSDQDDVWYKNKIEFMTEMANSNLSKEVFMCDVLLVDENLQGVGLSKIQQIENLGIDKTKYVMGCTIAVRKSFLDKTLPIPPVFKGHDNWIVELADKLDLRILDKTILQLYRRHGSNESISSINSLKKTRKKDKYTIILNRFKSIFEIEKWKYKILKKKLIDNKYESLKKYYVKN